jgi:hypothetical protein
LARITDEQEIREILIDAFENPTGEIIVKRGRNYAVDLRNVLAVSGVHQSDVCRGVNQLVDEGIVARDDEVRVAAFGSGTDPIPQKAVEFSLVRRRVQIS